MPSSSLLLRSSTTLVTALSLLSAPVFARVASYGPQSGSGYQLSQAYAGSSFFNGFDFFTDADPTHGFVTYVDEATAETSGLINTDNGFVEIKVDSTNKYNGSATYSGVNGVGRKSVRIASQRTYTHGLFLADIYNMPGGVCGTWPAFWTVGSNWPSNGEIDILEGANNMDSVLTSLHTGGTCVIDSATNETGTLSASDCEVYGSAAAGYTNTAGCGVQDPDTKSYGLGFNSNQGGVYAMEWTSDAIKVWFFERHSIPQDITKGQPTPANWGVPDSNFQGDCDIDSNFQNHQIVIDTTFCGDWAGNIWGQSCQAATGYASCSAYVGDHPEAFVDMYWKIKDIQVYTATSSGPTTTTSSSTTTRSTSYTTSAAATTTSSSSYRYGNSTSSTSWTVSSTLRTTSSASLSSSTASSWGSSKPTAFAWGSVAAPAMGGNADVTRTKTGTVSATSSGGWGSWGNNGDGTSSTSSGSSKKSPTSAKNAIVPTTTNIVTGSWGTGWGNSATSDPSTVIVTKTVSASTSPCEAVKTVTVYPNAVTTVTATVLGTSVASGSGNSAGAVSSVSNGYAAGLGIGIGIGISISISYCSSHYDALPSQWNTSNGTYGNANATSSVWVAPYKGAASSTKLTASELMIAAIFGMLVLAL